MHKNPKHFAMFGRNYCNFIVLTHSGWYDRNFCSGKHITFTYLLKFRILTKLVRVCCGTKLRYDKKTEDLVYSYLRPDLSGALFC